MNKTGDLRIDKIMPRIKDSWLKLPFENCLNEKTGGYKKLKKNDLRKSGKIPVVDQGERFITGYTNDESNLYQGGLPAVIFGDHTRRIKYIDFDFAVGADGTKILHPFEALSPKFFYHYLKALSLESQGYSRHYRFLKQIEVPIPPIIEQHRIVAKLERLLEKVDKCKERLEKIPTILKRFRQSVLAAACSGELTSNWRKESPGVEPVSTLLENNKQERIKRFFEACEKAKLSGQRKPQPFKGNSEKLTPEYINEMPPTWSWERLVNISHIQGGVTKGRKFKAKNTTQLPYLRVANVQDGFLDLREIKLIEALPEDLEKHRLEYGDILFTEGGDRDKLGRGTVWKNNIKNCIHQNHIFRARLYSPQLHPDFISLATKTEIAKEYFFANASQTVNLASINMTTLGNVPIPIPPEKEQIEIVHRVQTFFKIADEVAARYVKAAAHVNKLAQSILAKAFRGELVPQDPNEEPASELLKRIKAEREQREVQNPKIPKARKPYQKGKKAIQTSDKNRNPENVEKPERKDPSPVPVEKGTIAQKAKRKPLKAPIRQPLPLVDFDQQTIMAAFRKACRNRSEISREALLKAVASSLGYQRLSAKLRVKLQGDMRAAMMRGIIQSNGEKMIVPATRNVEDYDRDDLIKYACSVTKKGKLYEQDMVIRDTLKHLGFQRITERMRKAVASAIRSGIRNGLFVRDKGMIFRP